MKILIRNDKSKSWEAVESEPYRNEAELQELLAASPELIPLDTVGPDISELVAAVRELELSPTAYPDIVAFNPDGLVAVIECKLAANSEIRRKVVGQLLEYGAYLWGMSYEELEERVKRRSGKSLADLVREKVDLPDWDEEGFRASLRDSLSKGNFILVIAVNEINDELSRTITFLNSCGRPAFSFYALEVRRLKKGGVEILLPSLYGAASRPSGVKRHRWTEQEFFESVDRGLPSDVGAVIKDLYEWSKASAQRIWFGTGTGTGSFTFHFIADRKTVSVFSVFTNGNLMLNYGWLGVQVQQEVIEEFHRRIHDIPSFAVIPADFSKWPTIKIADAFVNQPEAVAQFKEAVVNLGDRIRS